MSEREQYGNLADELEDHADTLAHENAEFGGKIDDVRDDWERKRADDSVPGATPDWDDPDEEEDENEDDEPDNEDDEPEDEDA
jgi:hypothetical protein